MKYDVYSDFDIQKHKETFTNYLEVVITEDGVIHYAVPSHQEYMIMLAMHQNGWTRAKLREVVCKDPDSYDDFMVWLSRKTHSVSVWNDYIVFYEMNSTQWSKLNELKTEGLFHGQVPSRPITLNEYMEEKYAKSYGTQEIW